MRCVIVLSLLTLATVVLTEPQDEDRVRVKMSDDVNTASLQTLVEQQASLMQTLQAELVATRHEVGTLKNRLQTVENKVDAKTKAVDVVEPEADDNVRVKRSDDVSSLQTLVEQQASLIQTLQADLTATKAKVTTLENGLQSVVAKTTPVAFSARIAGSHDSWTGGLSLGQHQTVVFDEAITNVGQAYNVNTGIFTAPVAGTYAFFLSQMTPKTHGDLYLVMTKNGATLDVVYSEGGEEVNDQGSSHVTTHMAAGDQVWVRQNSGDAVRGDWYTIFTGYLLQAE